MHETNNFDEKVHVNLYAVPSIYTIAKALFKK